MLIVIDSILNFPWLVAKILLACVLGVIIVFELINAVMHGKLKRPCFIADLEHAIARGIAFVGDAFFARRN